MHITKKLIYSYNLQNYVVYILELESTIFKNKSFFGTWKLESLKNTMDHSGTCKVPEFFYHVIFTM